MPKTKTPVPIERIENKIYLIRNHKVMIDSDLAEIYGVSTIRLNEQVRRNAQRFPGDFMFQLTGREFDSLRSQIAILKNGRGKHRKFLPYVFTEHGAVMLASVLKSPVAVEASIQVVRAFVKLREVLSTHKELASKFQLLENKFDKHDGEIQALFEAIRQLMGTPNPPRKKSGIKGMMRGSEAESLPCVVIARHGLSRFLRARLNIAMTNHNSGLLPPYYHFNKVIRFLIT